MNHKKIEVIKNLIKRIDNEVLEHNRLSDADNRLSAWKENMYDWFLNIEIHTYFYKSKVQRDIAKVKRFCRTMNKIYNIYGEGKFND